MPMMELKPNAGSDRAWVWNTLADYADECPKPELLAIRFLNAESKYYTSKPVFGFCCEILGFLQTGFPPCLQQCSSWVMRIYNKSILFTDAQKFKVKFDECKEEVRKNLESTGM